MSSARTTLAVAGAAAAGSVALVTGAVPGSVVTLVVLAVVARAAVAAVEPGGARILARQIRLGPAWVALAVAASVRAGSVSLEDVRGAHAVLGPAISHGSVIAVIGAIIGAIAGAAIASVGTGSVADRACAALQVAVVVALFAGPQIRGARDVLPWTIGLVAVAAATLAAERVTRWERSDLLIAGASVASAGLVVAGTPL